MTVTEDLSRRKYHRDRSLCIIRSAEPGEAAMLSALALRSKSYWGYSSAFIDSCRDELAYRGEDIQSNRFRFAVAEVDEVCMGFYALRRVSSEEIELEALFVEPGQIGKGYGRRLIDHAKAEAAAWGAARLIIQADPHADAFYRAAGGKVIGQRESESIGGRLLPLFAISLP